MIRIEVDDLLAKAFIESREMELSWKDVKEYSEIVLSKFAEVNSPAYITWQKKVWYEKFEVREKIVCCNASIPELWKDFRGYLSTEALAIFSNKECTQTLHALC